jgi:hypothetical protein
MESEQRVRDFETQGHDFHKRDTGKIPRNNMFYMQYDCAPGSFVAHRMARRANSLASAAR